MESTESPFMEMDVYADWSGDPSDEAEVKIVLEVCSPILKLKPASHRNNPQLTTASHH